MDRARWFRTEERGLIAPHFLSLLTPDRPVTRWTLLALALIVALVASVFGGALYFIRAERAAAQESFARDHLLKVQGAARILEDDFRAIGDDLLFAGKLVEAASTVSDRTRELSTLLAVEPYYRLIQLFDPEGNLLLSVSHPGEKDLPEREAFAELMRSTAEKARAATPGFVTTTPPLAFEGKGWFRVFSSRLDPQRGPRSVGVVTLLVDTEPLFAKLNLVTSGQDTSLMLLGAHGRPTPITSPKLARAVSSHLGGQSVGPNFSSLMQKINEGETGTLILSANESRALSLGAAPLIAAYAAIPTSPGQHWELATFTSTAPLEAQQRAGLLRFMIATGAIMLGLIVIGVFLVLTSRREVAMRERLKSAAELAHLHEKTEKILDTIPTGVMSLSQDLRITALNSALREKLPSTSVGIPVLTAFPDAPGAVGAFLQQLAESALSAGKTQRRLGERLALFGHDGQYNLHAVPLERRFTEARVLLVVEDLSEVRSLESQLLRAEKLATVGVLAAGIAHEIGTPLGIVRGRAEYLQGKLEEPSAVSGLSVIIEQIDRVTRTLRELLDFSRVRPAVARPTSLVQLVRTVGELVRYEGERRRVSLSVEVPESLPAIAADPDQLQQVLINLVMNAYDACEPGGTIQVRAMRAEGELWSRVRLEVIDDGCGIPEDRRAQVFDPFFTTRKRGQGTGLGLTMVAQIVRNHGGQIELESEEGKGTRVSLLWPIAEPGELEEVRRNVG